MHYSSAVNIHNDPNTFVRFILGASSDNAEFVGFDSTIFFEDGKRYIMLPDAKNKNSMERYPLKNMEPVFDQRAIRGRGTCCWLVDIDGELFIVKDAWRSAEREPEWKFLQKVGGLDGVGQMKAYQDNLSCISKLRGLNPKCLPAYLKEAFDERILSRITLICHGRSIESFKTRLQLLYAYRDAICGMFIAHAIVVYT